MSTFGCSTFFNKHHSTDINDAKSRRGKRMLAGTKRAIFKRGDKEFLVRKMISWWASYEKCSVVVSLFYFDIAIPNLAKGWVFFRQPLA